MAALAALAPGCRLESAKGLRDYGSSMKVADCLNSSNVESTAPYAENGVFCTRAN